MMFQVPSSPDQSTIPCVGLIVVLEMLPRAGQSQFRLLDQLGHFASGILKAKSTSCPGSEGPRPRQGFPGRAVTSEHPRAAPALGHRLLRGCALPVTLGSVTAVVARPVRGMGSRGASPPGWFHPQEPRALWSSGVSWARDKPELHPRVLAGTPALCAQAGWVMPAGCGGPGDMAGRAGAWLAAAVAWLNPVLAASIPYCTQPVSGFAVPRALSVPSRLCSPFVSLLLEPPRVPESQGGRRGAGGWGQSSSVTRGADTGILLSQALVLLVLLEPHSGFPLPGAGSQRDVPGPAAAQPPSGCARDRVVAGGGCGCCSRAVPQQTGIGKAPWVAGDTRPWELPGCSCLP